MNLTRDDMIQSDATMNQMRNMVYHLERFMKINGVSESREKLRRMGQNIARTYVKYWKPIDNINLSNVRDFMATIYKHVLNSSVSIEINKSDKTIMVQDNDCSLCKYQFNDIDVAGCEIIAAMISEIVSCINKEKSSIILEPLDVLESRTFGHKSCIQRFKYEEEGV
jgi:ribosomal protein L25 (general stress protein Ctc)